MIVEGGIGAERGDHRFTCADHQPHDHAENAVDAFPDADMGGRNAEMGAKRLFQREIFRIIVLPDLARMRLHRGNHRGRRAKAVFIRTDAGEHLRIALPLDGLRADKRYGRGKGLHQRGEMGKGCHLIVPVTRV